MHAYVGVVVVAVHGGKLIDLLIFSVMFPKLNDECDGFCHFVSSCIDTGVVISTSLIVTKLVWSQSCQTIGAYVYFYFYCYKGS